MKPLKEILNRITYDSFLGNENQVIAEIIQLDTNNQRDDIISWCSEKNLDGLYSIKKGTIICPVNVNKNALSKGCNYIFSNAPRSTFKEVVILFYNNEIIYCIEPSAYISNKAQVHPKVYIGHNVVVEDGCIINEGTSIGHNTVILQRTAIGRNVKIGSNNTIGGVGFGYEKNAQGEYEVIPHIGNVIIKDNVEIGNNTCIDRAVLGSTIISENVKIDNLVHIAHGVLLKENSLIIANAMVAGSVQVGKNSWIAPSSSILNKTVIGDDVTIGMGAVVLRDVESGKVVVGNPAKLLEKK